MSVTNGMRPVHPGEILGEELEEPWAVGERVGQGLWMCGPRIELRRS